MASPNAAVLAARSRRIAGAGRDSARTQWFINEVSNKIAITLKNRVRLATEFVKTKVVKNISIAVERTGSGVIRSKSGEFPRADTTELMRTMFTDHKQVGPGIFDGFVGTPLDYGLLLEMKAKKGIKGGRRYLTRTLIEETPTINRIIRGPIK